MEVLQFIFILALAFGLAALLNTTEKSKGVIDRISFKESLDLSDLPIITFFCGDKKLNFLLDTGSTHTHISSETRDSLSDEDVTETNYGDDIETIGFNGDKEVQKSILISLKYKDTEYPTKVYVNSGLSMAFKEIKDKNGIQLHGVLGNDFFNVYDYIIDFKDFIVYSKKKK